MRELKTSPPPRTPDIRRYIGVCMACHHWQVDVRPGAVSDLGGAQPALMAIAQAHVEHLDDCPAGAGRVKFGDTWVEPPRMESGRRADGTLEMQPFPRWWVTR